MIVMLALDLLLLLAFPISTVTMRFNKRVYRYRQHRDNKGVKIRMHGSLRQRGYQWKNLLFLPSYLLWFLFLQVYLQSIFIMITSSDQALADSTTSNQPIVSQSCVTSSSNSSSDVK